MAYPESSDPTLNKGLEGEPGLEGKSEAEALNVAQQQGKKLKVSNDTELHAFRDNFPDYVKLDNTTNDNEEEDEDADKDKEKKKVDTDISKKGKAKVVENYRENIKRLKKYLEQYITTAKPAEPAESANPTTNSKSILKEINISLRDMCIAYIAVPVIFETITTEINKVYALFTKYEISVEKKKAEAAKAAKAKAAEAIPISADAATAISPISAATLPISTISAISTATLPISTISADAAKATYNTQTAQLEKLPRPPISTEEPISAAPLSLLTKEELISTAPLLTASLPKAPPASDVNQHTAAARVRTPLTNATTLREIYKTERNKFPKWVLDTDRWTGGGGANNNNKLHKFKETIVVYDDDDNLAQVKELVEQREPVNITMGRDFSGNVLETEFGWKKGAYGKSTKDKLYPNIGIYCHARVIITDDRIKSNSNEKFLFEHKNKEIDVHVMNLVGYAFDSIEQPDYKYFMSKYGSTGKFVITDTTNMDNFKKDLIERYRKIWLKACYMCKYKGLTNLFIYGVGNNNFASLLDDNILSPADRFTREQIFHDRIFLPAFGFNTTTSESSPKQFCDVNGITVENAEVFVGFKRESSIPLILFEHKKNDLKTTLFINAWDPWSIIGNGNFDDNSLDGFWGRSSNLSVLGWPMTNPELMKDITGRDDSEQKQILSMTELINLPTKNPQ